MTREEHAAEIREDVAEVLNMLSERLHGAFVLARKLDRQGVDMRALSLHPDDIKRLRDAAEQAYTLDKFALSVAT